MLTSIMTISRLTPCSSTLPHWHLGDVRNMPDKSVTYLKPLMLLHLDREGPPGANGKQMFSLEPSPVDVETWSNYRIRCILRPYFAMSIHMFSQQGCMDYFFLRVSVCFSTSFQWTCVSFNLVRGRGIQWWHYTAIRCRNIDHSWPVKSVFSLHCCWFFFCWVIHMPRQSWLP